jgi:SAM-dependent methyltransferase
MEIKKRELLEYIKELYEKNGNIMEYLRKTSGEEVNTPEAIMISYDFQAGSYNEFALHEGKKETEEFCDASVKILNKYIHKLLEERTSDQKSYTLLEAGVGEGTTLGGMWDGLDKKPECVYGFDISWSRIKEGNGYLDKKGVSNRFLFVGDMFSMPLKDNAIDIVYTSHAMEPNGGGERRLLKELYRATKKYLILYEPSSEFANEEQKKYMEKHGYIKNLLQEAKDLGFLVVEHKLLEAQVNELNPTAVLVIEKKAEEIEGELLCDPIGKGALIKGKSSYFSKEGLLAYPIVEDIPCLMPDNAILAIKWSE